MTFQAGATHLLTGKRNITPLPHKRSDGKQNHQHKIHSTTR
ncbi:hypothetical protein HMPREF0454_00520 [Hafnia alvei ATCC 51873]|uniref:Uncharacterized protein n=1 Tax=Hafnia alvei ATCC 51873 TaxID=1002364 RepID=G9Y1V2_HAFAL|nr:hypothetical protein HMPREF0454_00520 [Hafnia alvei ATCC 51873]